MDAHSRPTFNEANHDLSSALRSPAAGECGNAQGPCGPEGPHCGRGAHRRPPARAPVWRPHPQLKGGDPQHKGARCPEQKRP